MTTTAKPVEGAVDAALNFVDINWAALVGADRDTLVPALCSAIKSRDAAVRRAALEEAARVADEYETAMLVVTKDTAIPSETVAADIAFDIRSLVEG